MMPSTSNKKSPDTDGPKRVGQLGKRRRIKKSHDDFEFYDTPGNRSMQMLPPVTDLICDFCLQTSSSNKKGLFEELLMCKDCPAKAHPSCMSYCEILSRRARLDEWQCIDCKTCCLCLNSGHPDHLLFCDACDKGYHMFCHDPPIKEKPNGDEKWACRACTADGVNSSDLVNLNDGSTGSSNSHQDSVFTELPSSPNNQSNVSVGPVDTTRSAPSTSQETPSNKQYLPPRPSQWSAEHVAQYIQECGFQKEAKNFLDQSIDGRALMLLMRQDVLDSLGLKLGPAVKIYEKIMVLQKGHYQQLL